MHQNTWDSLRGFVERGAMYLPLTCNVKVAATSVLGKHIPLQFNSSMASDIEVFVWYGNRFERIELIDGQHATFLPRCIGTHRVHAIARRGEETIDTEKHFSVVAPPVKVELSSNCIEGDPGDQTELSWIVSGATQLKITSLNRGVDQELPLAGSLSLQILPSPETLVFEARSFDGKTVCTELNVVPQQPIERHCNAAFALLGRSWV